MKLRKLTALLLGATMTLSLLAGCGASTDNGGSASTDATTTTESTDSSSSDSADASTEAKTEYADDEIVDFTMFTAMPGSEINDGNDIQEIIAKKTGVRVKET